MSHHFHAVVSIDHAQAVIFEFSENDVKERRIRMMDRQGNIHHKAGSVGSGHAHDSKSYLTAVVEALEPLHEVLIVGHGTAKDELLSYIQNHAHLLAPRIMGTKSIDKLTDREIVAFAREFFKSKDLTTPQL
jgi:hypothetical protein